MNPDEITENHRFAVNTSEITAFLKKNYVWLLVLIPIFLSIYFRMASASLPMTDNWAATNINYFIQQDSANFVNQQYPSLPDVNKNKIVSDELAAALKVNSYIIKTGDYKGQAINIKDEIAKSSESFKEFWRYEIGGKSYVYMPDIDPYFYMRYARNMIEKGQIGDEIKNGVQWDNHMLAPVGTAAEEEHLHARVLAWLYKILHTVKPSMDLMATSTYFPIIFAALACIPAFFIGRKFAGNVGGTFASIMVAINPAFLSRTTFGHADTDVYTVLFPLIIIWLFMEGFGSQGWKKYSLMSAAGLFVGIFAYAWAGWWYVFDFIMLAAGINFIYLVFARRSEIKTFMLGIVAFFAASALFTGLLKSFLFFSYSMTRPFAFISSKVATSSGIWPNVYTTVAELNPSTVTQIIDSIGGKLFLVIAFFGIAFALLRKDESGKMKILYPALLFIWLPATIYASTKGVRFSMLLVPALALAYGNAVGKICDYVSDWGSVALRINKKVIALIVILIFILLLLGPAKAWYAQSKQDVPMINDAWYSALTNINKDSQPNAIINSWWDFGHHFKYIADRAVTFDGASQNSPMAHWIGKVLLTSDEDLAVGILRMLDCGSNNAFVELDKNFNDTSKSVNLLYQVVVLDKSNASQLLEQNGVTNIDAVLANTHCIPPEDYFITSDDMISKAGVWAHFGSWDFDKADAWVMKNQSVIKEITNEEEANSWIAPWYSYASGLIDCQSNNETAVCGGVFVNLTTMDTTMQTQQGIKNLSSIVYASNGTMVEKKFGNGLPYLISLIPSGEGYNAILMQPELGMSMFNRLYFFQGYGLEHFKLFDVQQQLTGGTIYTWKINWTGGQK